MNKKILFTIITTSLLIAGCGKNASTNNLQQSEKPSFEKSIEHGETADSQEESMPITTATADTTAATSNIEYEQYLKKTWVRNTDSDFPDNGGVSIIISKVGNGKIQGEISVVGHAPAYNMDNAEFEGTVINDTAECQLVNDSRGNEGIVELLLKPDNTIEATITITEKSEDTVMRLPEGTFVFTPYNLKNINGFEPIKDQTFMTDLNTWGNVQFVSGKLTDGNHIPVVFYLTNEEGDILYQFNAVLPYSVDVTAVSFQDVNKDGLKDIIIIVKDNYDEASGEPLATVYLQEEDGSFTNDNELNQEINDSGNNKDISTIASYLSSKF